MSEIKPTPGPWEAERINNSNCFDIKCECGFFIATCHDGVRSESNAEANARLIAEAGTVHHETGLTPRQLVERVKELKAASKHCEDLLTSYEINRVNGEELADTALAMLRAALAKCEGVKP